MKKRNTIVSSNFYGNGSNSASPAPTTESGEGNMNLAAGSEDRNQDGQLAQNETTELTDGNAEDDKA